MTTCGSSVMPTSAEEPDALVDTSVADALVGAVAAEQGIPLATRDRRAVDIYRALGVEVELLS